MKPPAMSAWDRKNGAVIAAFERPQKGRQHGAGLPLGIMEQHDAAASGLEPPQDELQLGLRRHRDPVARPEIGAENDDPAPFQPFEQPRRGGKTGKAEN